MPGGISNCGGCAAATLTTPAPAPAVEIAQVLAAMPAPTVEGNQPGFSAPAMPAPCGCTSRQRMFGLLLAAVVVYLIAKG